MQSWRAWGVGVPTGKVRECLPPTLTCCPKEVWGREELIGREAPTLGLAILNQNHKTCRVKLSAGNSAECGEKQCPDTDHTMQPRDFQHPCRTQHL